VGNQLLDTQHLPSLSRKFFISIGGIRCAIFSYDTGFLDLLQARYRWFESSGPAAYEILIKLVSLEDLTLENAKMPLQPMIKKVNSGDNYIIKQADNQFVAVVNTSSKKVLLKMRKSEYCFDSFLRMLFTLILVDERGFLLQASAVSENGRGSVFFGPSGSGKSTVARLSEERTVLSDELVLVKPHNGGYRVYGTPFWSGFSPDWSNARAELSGLYSLKKAQTNGLMSLDRVQALTKLYQCVPFFKGDVQLQKRILGACFALVNTVPVYELHFLPDLSFWQVLNESSPEGSKQLYSDTRPRHAT
jgi:hypothetical protein